MLAPVEADPLSRDVIAAATAAGIVVVEPAGNEGIDLGSLGSPWLARHGRRGRATPAR